MGNANIGVLNRFARYCSFYVFQTAYEDAQGARIELSPVAQLGGVVDVPPAAQSNATVGMSALLDGLRDGTVVSPWIDGETRAVALTPFPGASTTEFTLVGIGPGFGGATPPVFGDPDFILVQDEWTRRLAEHRVATFVVGFVVPLSEGLGFGSALGRFSNPAESLLSLRGVIEPVLDGAGVSLDSRQGYEDAIGVIVERAASDATFRENLIRALVSGYEAATGTRISESAMSANLRRLTELGSVRHAVETSVRAGDIGSLLGSLAASDEAVTWTATLSGVRIDPQTATLTRTTNSVTLRAVVADDDGVTYRWSTTGENGELFGVDADGTPRQGIQFTTDTAVVDYAVADLALIVEGVLDTVTVAAFHGTDLLGTATATIRGGDADDEPTPVRCGDFDATPYTAIDPAFTIELERPVHMPGNPFTITLTADFNKFNPSTVGFAVPVIINGLTSVIDSVTIDGEPAELGSLGQQSFMGRVIGDVVPPRISLVGGERVDVPFNRNEVLNTIQTRVITIRDNVDFFLEAGCPELLGGGGPNSEWRGAFVVVGSNITGMAVPFTAVDSRP